jgi:hypothetical protein
VRRLLLTSLLEPDALLEMLLGISERASSNRSRIYSFHTLQISSIKILLFFVILEILALLKMLIISFSFLWKWKALCFACSFSVSLHCLAMYFLLHLSCLSYVPVNLVIFLYVSFSKFSFITSGISDIIYSIIDIPFLYPNIFSTALWIMLLMIRH